MVQSVQSSYSKDAEWRTFIMEWIPGIVLSSLVVFSFFKAIIIAYRISFTEEFVIKDYLISILFLLDLICYFVVVSISEVLIARRKYRITKSSVFASIDNEKLVLNFGRDSFLWTDVQSVKLEGERKLIIVYTDKGKKKKKLNDLIWLSGKKDFIQNLKKICIENNIPFSESEMTFFSRIRLSLRMAQ